MSARLLKLYLGDGGFEPEHEIVGLVGPLRKIHYTIHHNGNPKQYGSCNVTGTVHGQIS